MINIPINIKAVMQFRKHDEKKQHNSDAKKRILLVDDEELMLDILKFALHDDNHFVALARSGKEALAVFRENSFDLVISDIRMPGMDGIQLLTEIKKIDATADVIILTAYISKESYLQAMRCGATEYLNKPIRINDIKSVVQKHLNKSRSGWITRLKIKLSR